MIIIFFSLLLAFLFLYLFFLKFYVHNKNENSLVSFIENPESIRSNRKLDTTKELKLDFDFISFDAGMSHLNESNQQKLRKLFEKIPQIQTIGVLEIMGLADQTGDRKGNENLAKMRGIAVYNFLVKNGFPKEAIRLTRYQVVKGNTPEERKRFRSVKLAVKKIEK